MTAERIRAFETYVAADDAWAAAMAADPVARATVNARYLPEGKGAAGSFLRAAYERRDAARFAYEKAIFGKQWSAPR